MFVFFFFFFFQAEDGIRDLTVTGVQTCALPICLGTDQAQDVLVYERPDQPDWGFGAAVTDDGRYVVLHVWLGTDRRNRVYCLDLRSATRPKVTGAVTRLLDDFDAGYGFIGNDEIGRAHV